MARSRIWCPRRTAPYLPRGRGGSGRNCGADRVHLGWARSAGPTQPSRCRFCGTSGWRFCRRRMNWGRFGSARTVAYAPKQAPAAARHGVGFGQSGYLILRTLDWRCWTRHRSGSAGWRVTRLRGQLPCCSPLPIAPPSGRDSRRLWPHGAVCCQWGKAGLILGRFSAPSALHRQSSDGHPYRLRLAGCSGRLGGDKFSGGDGHRSQTARGDDPTARFCLGAGHRKLCSGTDSGSGQTPERLGYGPNRIGFGNPGRADRIQGQGIDQPGESVARHDRLACGFTGRDQTGRYQPGLLRLILLCWGISVVRLLGVCASR